MALISAGFPGVRAAYHPLSVWLSSVPHLHGQSLALQTVLVH